MSDIRVYTQNCIRISGSGTVIYADPFKVTDDPGDADIILITHSHYDHYSVGDIRKVISDSTVFVAPEPMTKDISGEFPGHDVVGVVPEKTYDIHGLIIETIPAYNKLKPFHPKRSGWVGYIVTVDTERIYIAGDTDVTPEAEKVRCDTALVPIGGFYTMNAKEAAQLINAIRPAKAIPTHFGSVAGSPKDADTFAKYVDDGIIIENIIENL